ncbi:MAG: hypothetical protein AAB972_03830 [Patescibacteria group bacterium]
MPLLRVEVAPEANLIDPPVMVSPPWVETPAVPVADTPPWKVEVPVEST